MDTYKLRSTAQACGAQVASEISTPRFQQIKRAPDVLAAAIVAVRRVGRARPRPPQNFTFCLFPLGKFAAFYNVANNPFGAKRGTKQ